MTNKKVMYKFGQSDIDLNSYIHNLGTNLTGYMDSNNFNEGLRLEFTKVYDKYLTALKALSTNNTDRFSTNDYGSILDKLGEISSTDIDDDDTPGSDFYYDKNGKRIDTYDFDRLKKKHKKNYNTFSANKEVATYFNSVGTALKEKLAPKAKFNILKDGFVSRFNKTYNPAGGQFNYSLFQDKDTLDEKTNIRGTLNRAKLLREELTNYITNVDDADFLGSPFGSKENYITKLQAALAQLSNGYNSDVAIALNLAGIGKDFQDNYFSNFTQSSVEPTVEPPVVDQVEEKPKNPELEAKRTEAQAFKTLGDTHSKSQTPLILPKIGFDRGEWAQPEYEGRVTDALQNTLAYLSASLSSKEARLEKSNTRLRLVNHLDLYFTKAQTKNKELEDDEVNSGAKIIPESLDAEKGIIRSYNPKTRTVYTLPAYQTKYGKKTWEDWYNTNAGKKPDPLWDKEGGILIARNGDSFAAFANKKKQESINSLIEESTSKESFNDTLQQNHYGLRKEATKESLRKPAEGFSGTDIARLSSAGLDVASLISAYVPGPGTIVSAVTGVGSTLATLGADIAEDGLDWGDAGNALVGLGMDAVGLVPGFGSAGKAGKIAKNLARFVPRIMVGLSATQVLTNGTKASWDKLVEDPSKLTVNDWQNISKGLSTLAGAGKMAAGSLKYKAMRKATRTGDNNIEVKDGRQLRVTPELLENIKGAKSIKEANEKLQSIKGYENEEMGSFFHTGFWNLKKLVNPRVGKDYDYTKLRNTLFDSGTKKFNDATIFEKVLEGKFPINIKFPDINIKNPYAVKMPKKSEVIKPIELLRLPATVATPKAPIITPPPGSYRTVPLGTDRTNHNSLYERRLLPNLAKGGTLNLTNVRKFQNAGKLTNTKSTANWHDNMFSSNEMKSWLGTFTKDNYNNFNDLLKSYATNLTATLYVPGAGAVPYNEGVKDRQAAWNITGTNQVIEDLATKGTITRRGKSGDNATSNFQDGYFGSLEYLRHGGSKTSWEGNEEGLKKFLAESTNKGLNYSLDKESGMYLLSPINEQTITPNNTISNTVSNDIIANDVTDVPELNLGKNKFSLDPTISYGLPRAMFTNRMNRKMTDMAQEVTPLLKDPMQISRITRGDLDAEVRGLSAYASIRNMTRLPISSDANVNLALLLETELKGLEAINAGNALSNQVQRQYDEMAWQLEKENAVNRNVTAMFNRGSMSEITRTKSLMELAYVGQTHNVWDSLAQLLEENAKDKLEENKLIAQNFAQSDIDSSVNNNLAAYAEKAGKPLTTELINLWNSVINGTSRPTTPEELTTYAEVAKIASQIKLDLLADYLKIGRSRWSKVRNSNISNKGRNTSSIKIDSINN